MENLELYNKIRTVPQGAKKEIKGGRLNGKTDINPMWRLKTLTEQFGICGIGWRYEVVRLWLETGANEEVAAFAHINLFIKQGEQWSEAIQGVGGSMFVEKESKGLHISDECYKMALTDAISVACKALGMGADVYWDKDTTKYDKQEKQPENDYRTQLSELMEASKGKITGEVIAETIEKKFGKKKANELNQTQFTELIKELTNENQSKN